TVQVNNAVDAGADATITRCSSDAPIDLFTVLGGAPHSCTTVSGPNGALSGTFDPATDAPGAYVYTVTGVAPCGDDAATVTVQVNNAVDAGADATITRCSSDAPIDLFTMLGGTPQSGGTWTGPNGTFSGTFEIG